MTVLLDTHALLWFLHGDLRLSRAARDAIEHPQNRAVLSLVSLWEIAVKVTVGKLVLSRPVEDLIRHELTRNDIDLLPATPEHVVVLSTLPLHHRDPFDRLLIAQAMAEDLRGCK